MHEKAVHNQTSPTWLIPDTHLVKFWKTYSFLTVIREQQQQQIQQIKSLVTVLTHCKLSTSVNFNEGHVRTQWGLVT